MVEAILVSLFPLVACGQTQLLSASSHPELRSGDRLLARLGQPREYGCRFYIRCFSLFLISYDGWPWCHSYDYPFSSHSFPNESASGDSCYNWTWTNMSKSQTKTVASCCRMGRTICSQNNWCILWFPNSVLLHWSQITFTHHMRWSSWVHNDLSLSLSLSFEVVIGSEETVLSELLRTRTLKFIYALVQCASWYPFHFFHAQGPFDGSFPRGFGFRWFSDFWMTPSVGPNSSLFRRTYLFARWWSLTRNWVVSYDCTFCSCIWRSPFFLVWLAIVADFSFFIRRCCCLFCKHICLRTCIKREIGILHIQEHAKNYKNSHSDNFHSWSLSMVFC